MNKSFMSSLALQSATVFIFTNLKFAQRFNAPSNTFVTTRAAGYDARKIIIIFLSQKTCRRRFYIMDAQYSAGNAQNTVSITISCSYLTLIHRKQETAPKSISCPGRIHQPRIVVSTVLQYLSKKKNASPYYFS